MVKVDVVYHREEDGPWAVDPSPIRHVPTLDALREICLNGEAGREARDEMPPEHLFGASQAQINLMLELCEHELARLELQAKRTADIIWDEINERSKSKQKARFGVRVRMVNG